MKLIYLLPPSEGKNQWWTVWMEKLSFYFDKPLEIAIQATEKDLKCKGKRFEEGITLNKEHNITSSLLVGESWDRCWAEILPAIERYSWVMYNAIGYSWMSKKWKKYFEENFCILSGMYGILTPQDTIWNYKLPIETKGLYQFWWDNITQTLDELQADYIIDMLPWSYARMIDWKNLKTPYIRIVFFACKDWELKKITHGVKKVKWEYIKNLCENSILVSQGLIEKKVQISKNEYHIEIISET